MHDWQERWEYVREKISDGKRTVVMSGNKFFQCARCELICWQARTRGQWDILHPCGTCT
jgi:hypothetical protein